MKRKSLVGDNGDVRRGKKPGLSTEPREMTHSSFTRWGRSVSTSTVFRTRPIRAPPYSETPGSDIKKLVWSVPEQTTVQ